ncbi:MAG: hypothetical protein GY798_05470 [Hyphomicrobiales bacterium]|nr:hypothetical protein [Hyphomicrobiales bacterium]
MAFKPNYRQARNERSRTKAGKKQEKLRRREETAAQRKSDQEPDAPSEDTESEDTEIELRPPAEET